MSQPDKSTVVQNLINSGMVPVYNHPDLEICKSVLKACYDGGLRVFEFTNRSESAFDVFVELHKYARVEMPGMLIGVGSIIDAETTKRFIGAGADFIVSPAMIPEMAQVCTKEGVSWSPGCGTVTEVVAAINHGAGIVKLFPGSQVGGPGFVKAVLGPLPGIKLMPTGGVSPDKANLESWFQAGVSCVGMGSKLFPKDWINKGEFEKLAELVRSTLQIIEEIRNN